MTTQSVKSNKGIIIGIVVVLLIVAAVFLMSGNKDTTVADTTTVTETTPVVDTTTGTVDTTNTAATPSTASEEVTGTNAPVNEVPGGTVEDAGTTTGETGSISNRDTMGTSSDSTTSE